MMEESLKDRLKNQVLDALRSVQDPEVRLDIVNLGLIYNVTLKENSVNTFEVVIEMTLTSPTCPMAPYIFQTIHQSIELLEGVMAVDIQLIWTPPWSKDMISEEGRMELGMV